MRKSYMFFHLDTIKLSDMRERERYSERKRKQISNIIQLFGFKIIKCLQRSSKISPQQRSKCNLKELTHS